MKRKIFASRNHNHNHNNNDDDDYNSSKRNTKSVAAGVPTIASTTTTIDWITLDLVVTDLRAAPSSGSSNTRYRPFYQITNRFGRVLARSTIAWDCVLDASFPTVPVSWNEIMMDATTADAGTPPSAVESDAPSHATVATTSTTTTTITTTRNTTLSAAVVMREPLLITWYDFNHPHENGGVHTILGQVQTTLLELVDKNLSQQHQQSSSSEYNNNNNNNSTLLSLTQDDECRFAVIWQDVAVVGDMYVKEIRFHQANDVATSSSSSSSSSILRRLRRRSPPRKPVPTTRFDAQPGFPSLRHAIPPTGIPAGLSPDDDEEGEGEEEFASTNRSTTKKSLHTSYCSYDDRLDETLSTVSTIPSSYSGSPRCSPHQARSSQRGRKGPVVVVEGGEQVDEYYHVACDFECAQLAQQQQQQHLHARSQALLEAARERQQQLQSRLRKQEQTTTTITCTQRPYGYYQYATGRTEELIARAKRRVSDRSTNFEKFKEQQIMCGADWW